MKTSTKIVLIGATVVIATGAGLALKGARTTSDTEQSALFSSETSARPQVRYETIVANRQIKAGEFIRAGDITWTPVDTPAPNSLHRDTEIPTPKNDPMARVIGSVPRTNIEVGGILLSDNIVRPGEAGFLAAVLNEGMRAATVAVTPASSASGLIYPGDHVDILLSQLINVTDAPDENQRVTETILHSVRVLATDRNVPEGIQTGEESSKVPRTMTIEVTGAEAEVLYMAAEMGTLSAALLSSAEEKPPINPEGPYFRAMNSTWASIVSPGLSIAIEKARKAREEQEKKEKQRKDAEAGPVIILRGSKPGQTGSTAQPAGAAANTTDRGNLASPTQTRDPSK